MVRLVYRASCKTFVFQEAVTGSESQTETLYQFDFPKGSCHFQNTGVLKLALSTQKDYYYEKVYG